jgi:hypothetical protein
MVIGGIVNSTNLKAWTPLVTFSGSGGAETITDPNANAGKRFYRIWVSQ